MNGINTEIELEKAIKRIEKLESRIKVLEIDSQRSKTIIKPYDLNSVSKNRKS